MAGKARTGLEAVNNYLYEYLSRRSVEGVASCVTSDVTFIGTGADERARGLKSFLDLMQKNIASSPEPFDYELVDAAQTKESASVTTVSCGLHAGRGDLCGMLVMRCLFVARKSEDDGYRLSSVCLSVANCLQQDDEFFPFVFSERELRDKLHKAEKRLELTINSVPGAIAVYELTKKQPHLTYVSEGWERLTGYSADEYMRMLKKRESILVTEAEKAAFSEKFLSAVNAHEGLDLEEKVTKKSGETAFLAFHAIPAEDEAGMTRYYAYINDITEQTRAREELYQNEQSLSIAFGTANIFHWELDLKTLEFSGSGRVHELFGSELEDDKLETWLNCNALVEPYKSRAEQLFKAVIAGENEASAEVKLPRPDGTNMWLRLRATRVYNSDGEAVKAICTGENIDAYKDLQERFEKVMQQNGIRTWEYFFATRSIQYMSDKAGAGMREMNYLKNVPESAIALRIVHPDSVDTLREMYARLERGMSNVSCTTKWYVGGQERWIRTDYTIIFDNDMKPLRAIGSGHDVTSEMDARLRFEETVTFQETVAKNSLLSLVVDITTGKVLSYRGSGGLFNPVHTHSAADLITHALQLMADDTERVNFARTYSAKNILKRFEKGQLSFSDTYRLISIDAKPLWIEFTGNLSRDPDSGDVICIIYGVDRTDQMTARAIIDAITSYDFDFIANVNIFSGDMRVFKRQDEQTDVLTRGEEVLFSDFVHNALDKYILPEDREAASEAFNVANVYKRLKSAPMFEHIYKIRDNSGAVRIKKTRFANYDLRNGMVLFSRTDITELMAEQDRQKRVLTASLKLAESANRAKTDFLSRMSHDMRTPMNAILGFSELGADSGDINEARSYHEKVNSSGKYLLALINDALDMSKIENDRMSIAVAAFCTREVIARLNDLLSPRAADKEIALSLSVNENVPEFVVGDRLRIEQIFMNLLGNSVKYTKRGGHVSLELEKESESYGTAMLRCVIKDDGVGMSEEFQQRMFTPFEQEETSRERFEGGTGLGLSIVKRLIDLMDGSISCKSAPGEGTEFTVRLSLPVAERSAAGMAATQLSAMHVTASELAGRCVLLCEDHPLNAQITIKLLSKRGMIVEHAENGRIGLELFDASERNHYDAVLMDVRMPVMDGIEAARAIRALNRPDAKTVPIIALTANAYDEDIKQTADAGMTAHIAKPVEARTLYQTLESYL